MSKFDDLMKYLENDSNIDAPETNGTIIQSKMSSFRYGSTESINTSTASTGYKKKSYVWEEDTDNSDEVVRNQSQSDDGITSNPKHPMPNIDSDISTMAIDLQSKIKLLRESINDKSLQIKEVHNELIRLENAKIKRREKCKSAWDKRREDFQKERIEANSTQDQIILKLQSEVSDLKKKRQSLIDRKAHFIESHQSTIENVRKDFNRKMIRSRQQWEQEEMAHFQVVFEKKKDSMRKHVADEIAPKLDQFVAESRSKIQSRVVDVKANIEQFKTSLEHENQTNLRNEMEVIKARKQEEVDAQSRQYCSEIESLRRRCADDVRVVYDRNCRGLKEVEETADKLRRLDAQTVVDRVQQLRQSETEQLKAMKVKCDRELAELTDRCSEELRRLKAELATQVDEARRDRSAKKRLIVQRQIEKKSMELKSQYAEETDRIILKLREDSVQESKRKEDAIKREVQFLRLQLQEKSEELRLEEKEKLEVFEKLRDEIKSLEQEIEVLNSNLSQYQLSREHEDSEMIKLKGDLDTEKKQFETSLERLIEYKSNRAKDAEKIRDAESGNAEIERLARREADLKEKVEAAKRLSGSELDQLLRKQQDEIRRVQEKIQILFARRDASLTHFNQQLNASREEAQELSVELNYLRNSHVNENVSSKKPSAL